MAIFFAEAISAFKDTLDVPQCKRIEEEIDAKFEDPKHAPRLPGYEPDIRRWFFTFRGVLKTREQEVIKRRYEAAGWPHIVFETFHQDNIRAFFTITLFEFKPEEDKLWISGILQ